MNKPVLCLHLINTNSLRLFYNAFYVQCQQKNNNNNNKFIQYYHFVQVLPIKIKTFTFNNKKLFKKFKEKLAVTPGAITCIPAQVHEKMETVTLHARMWFMLPPTEDIRKSNGKGVQEEAISMGVGSDSQGPGTLKQPFIYFILVTHKTLHNMNKRC